MRTYNVELATAEFTQDFTIDGEDVLDAVHNLLESEGGLVAIVDSS